MGTIDNLESGVNYALQPRFENKKVKPRLPKKGEPNG